MRTALPFAFVSMLITGASDAIAQRVPDAQVSTGPLRDTLVQVASSGSAVYAAWQCRRDLENVDVYFSRSLDGGVTWLPREIRLNEIPYDATNQQVAAAGSSVFATWQSFYRSGAARSRIWFDRSVDQGLTWLNTDVQLDVGQRSSFDPAVASSGSAVHVVWSGTTVHAIATFYAGSLDGGATWSAPRRLDTVQDASTFLSSRPQVVAVGSAVHVTWEDHRNGAPDIYFNRSTDNGVTWLPTDVRLDVGEVAGASRSEAPQIAASSSSVCVVWEDRRDGTPNIWINRSLDGGATWLVNAVRIDTSQARLFGSEPRIAVAGSTVHAVWTQGLSPTAIAFNRSLDGGTTWLPAELIVSGPGSGFHHSPHLAAVDDAVFVTWVLPQGSRSIRFNRSLDAGATWLADPVRMNIGMPAGQWQAPRHPDITVSASTVFVAWNDDRGFDNDIYGNIAFGFVPYGTGKVGAGGLVPAIAGDGLAALGETVSIEITDGTGGTGGALLVGGPGTRTSLPLFGATLLLIPELTLPIALGGTSGAPGAGSLSLPLPIPANVDFLGVDLYFQAILLDPSATGGVTLTNAIEMWIG